MLGATVCYQLGLYVIPEPMHAVRLWGDGDGV